MYRGGKKLETLLKEINEYLQEDALEVIIPSISIEQIGTNSSYSLPEKISSIVYSYIRGFSVPFAEHFEKYVGVHPSNLTNISLQIKKEILNKIHNLFEEMMLPKNFSEYGLHSNARLSTDKIRYLVQGKDITNYEWITPKEAEDLFNHYKKILFLHFEKQMKIPNDQFEEEMLKQILSLMSPSYSSLHKDSSMLCDYYFSSLFGKEKIENLRKIAFSWYQNQPTKFMNAFSITRENFHIFNGRLCLLTKEERKAFQHSFFELLQKEFYALKKKNGRHPRAVSGIRDDLKSLQTWL